MTLAAALKKEIKGLHERTSKHSGHLVFDRDIFRVEQDSLRSEQDSLRANYNSIIKALHQLRIIHANL